MKKSIIIAFTATLAMIACNKIPDAAVSLSTPTVTVGFEGTSEAISVDLKSNRAWSINGELKDWFTITPTSGTGNATLSIKVNPLDEVAARVAELVIEAGTAQAILQIVQGLPDAEDVKSGSFVLEEVFFAGCLLEDGKSNDAMDGDQYFKITNNTDNLLYADGLAICTSSETSQNGGFAYWLIDQDLSSQILVKNIYIIPGTGTDVPVLPGHSLVIAFAAQDFASENGYGINLSGADFEIFDGEDLDTDNPAVPNMEIVVKSSASFSFLHNRGYESYALVQFPEKLTEEFLAGIAFTGTRSFWMDGEALLEGDDYPAGSYLVENAWVVDGINCGVEEDYGYPAFNASIDAGYTGCGKVDKDPGRFGKSVLRKKVEGKLADTDNSTNDFQRDATPSLK